MRQCFSASVGLARPSRARPVVPVGYPMGYDFSDIVRGWHENVCIDSGSSWDSQVDQGVFACDEGLVGVLLVHDASLGVLPVWCFLQECRMSEEALVGGSE